MSPRFFCNSYLVFGHWYSWCNTLDYSYPSAGRTHPRRGCHFYFPHIDGQLFISRSVHLKSFWIGCRLFRCGWCHHYLHHCYGNDFGNYPHKNDPDAKGTGSIVPLAFPIIAGAGTLSTILSLRAVYQEINILIGIFVNLVVVYTVLRISLWLELKIGKSGFAVLRRVFGVILLAIAVKIIKTNVSFGWSNYLQTAPHKAIQGLVVMVRFWDSTVTKRTQQWLSLDHQ